MGKDAGIDRIDTYFAGVDNQPARRSPPALVQGLVRRARFADAAFTSAESFNHAVAETFDSARTQARIDAEVRRHGDVVARLQAHAGDNPAWTDLASKPAMEQYVALAVAGFVDPGNAFDDVPEMPTMCDFRAIATALKQGDLVLSDEQVEQLNNQFQQARQLFAMRFQRLTGRALAPGELPSVVEITQLKAPTPMRPQWSERLYAREAVALNAEPPTFRPAAGEVPSELPPPTPSPGCDADGLLHRAGAAPLRPPADGEPRYTFPGRLLEREDIFYDYALVVPVDECGPFAAEVTGTYRRSLAVINVLVREAIQVLDFLTHLDLADALGAGMAAEIETELNRLLLSVDETTPLHDVQVWRRRFAEYSALVRDAARRQLLLGRLSGADPRDFLRDLTNTLAAIPAFAQYQEDRIYGSETPEAATYLTINGHTIGNPRPQDGRTWIDPEDQGRNLSRYLEYLGGEFHGVLSGLVGAAENMRAAVEAFDGAGRQLAADFQQLAQTQINDAVAVLARLLDGVSELLPLWAEEWQEGSKRLGLLVIFRQHWIPEGYVKGKLVGYKNLMPAEKARIRQRTFVQTTTETTTATEFARTRQEDLSQTRKETAELLRESATKFNMSLSGSGSFDIFIGSIEVTQSTGLDLSSMSRTTQSAIAEATFKSSVTYNERREVKIREERQIQEEFETENLMENPNQEITANYFYYQLLRQYLVTLELNDIRPVLLRTRDVPSEVAIDDKFLSDHAHELLYALPGQLADDVQESVHEIEPLARRLLRAEVEFNDRQLAYDVLRTAAPPATPEEARDRDARLAAAVDAVGKARTALDDADEAHLRARAKLDRVIGHVRRNRTHYMQYIWQASPRTDEDRILRAETFHGTPLPDLTRGLVRQGYYGPEEMFDYTGPAFALTDLLLRLLRPGSELASLPQAELERTSVFQQLRRYYSDDEVDDLLAQIASHAFVTDPAEPNTVLSSRRVQIAQDALVVEALPGQIPLLEGFKLAHRMLDVERACLENQHLAERIADRPWTVNGEDSYRVYRHDGQPLPPAEEGPPLDAPAAVATP